MYRRPSARGTRAGDRQYHWRERSAVQAGVPDSDVASEPLRRRCVKPRSPFSERNYIFCFFFSRALDKHALLIHNIYVSAGVKI